MYTNIWLDFANFIVNLDIQNTSIKYHSDLLDSHQLLTQGYPTDRFAEISVQRTTLVFSEIWIYL